MGEVCSSRDNFHLLGVIFVYNVYIFFDVIVLLLPVLHCVFFCIIDKEKVTSAFLSSKYTPTSRYNHVIGDALL